MAGSVNKVILVGNLGKDPEIRTMQSGSKLANLTVATSENWKDKATGERKEKTEWHRVVIFNENIAKVAENYLKKGAKVYIEGQLETRKWTDKDGNDKYTTEVVLRPYRGELTMLDSKGGSDRSSFQDNSNDDFEGGAPQRKAASGGGGRSAPIDEMEDEIPF